MAETGYVYVPDACARQAPCRVHIALHGCKQYAGLIADHYVRHAGYNEWADANNIIVLYPQTIAGNPLLDPGTPFNPNGCWDW
jgi:poly(3-hydroxybutyrate) depolymerase